MNVNEKGPGDMRPSSGDAARLELLTAVIGKLRIIVREINRHSVRTEKLIGIKTTELLFLQLICRRPGIRLSDVAHGLSIEQSTSSNVKRRLSEQGLIDEVMSSDDRRVSFLRPTEEGARRVATAVIELKSPLRTVTEATDFEDLRLLDLLLGDITGRIAAAYADNEVGVE